MAVHFDSVESPLFSLHSYQCLGTNQPQSFALIQSPSHLHTSTSSPLSHLNMASSHRIRKPPLRTSTMLNDHAKIQAVSLRPLRRRNSNSARKPSENHRGTTVPRGDIADRDDSASAPRIKKSVTLPRKQRRSSAPSLVQRFGGTTICSYFASRD